MKRFKDFICCGLSALLLASCASESVAPVKTNDCVILHAWSWSFNSIKDNMKDIADAGYSYIQTSPANRCVEGEDGGMDLFGKGKWYYHYQPTDWKIGNYQLGTREEFKAMCAEADKYGVKIIVDVLPNHTVIDQRYISAELDSAVGGRQNLFHANGLTPIVDYNDRYQCTTGEMGGLPDVNTENPDFQYYYMQYVNDLLACGADGFRYDTAKHIGLPTDPLDEKANVNDFWDVATGRKAIRDITLAKPADSLFIYGEVLQDKNVKEEEYGEYMWLTASGYGHVLRNVLNQHNAFADSLNNWNHKVSPDRLVTWVESHDTYCNAHESASIEDAQIRMGWVFLASRQFGTPLFYSRPNGSSRENYWGDNKIGARGNDEFKHPEVKAVNLFRKAVKGTPENILYSENGGQIIVERGNKAASIINLTDSVANLKVKVSLNDGVYTDKVYNQQIVVNDGILSCEIKPLTSYVFY